MIVQMSTWRWRVTATGSSLLGLLPPGRADRAAACLPGRPQLLFDEVRHLPEQAQVDVLSDTRFPVERAEHADALPAGRLDRLASIETNPLAADDKRIC